MKKIFALIGIVFLALSISGCSKDTGLKVTVTDYGNDVTEVKEEVEVTPDLTPEQESAYVTAEKRLDFMAFSKSELIDQLAGEGHAEEDIIFVIDLLDLDFNEQAHLKAEAYMRDPEKWTEQTLTDYLVKWEKFTQEEAEYGARRAFN